MKKTRLPQIPTNMPGKGGGRPLPPEPPKDNAGPPPPPLPSRPGARPQNGGSPNTKEADDSCDSDDHSTEEAPALPPRNFMEQAKPEKSKSQMKSSNASPSPEQEGETYEVPDLPPQVPPPIVRKPPVAPPSPSDSDSDSGGEVYDELEGIAEDKPQAKSQFKPKPAPPQDFQAEIYDECDVKEPDATTGGELYEDPEINPSDSLGGGEIYEVPDEATVPKPNTPSRRDAPVPPPPPGQKLPPLPPTSSLPAPVPSRSTGQTATKLETVKKMSGEGAPGMGISLDVLGQGRARLRKVGSGQDTEKEPDKGSLPEDVGDMTSVKDKISLFKAAESGSKPIIPAKPLFIPSKPTVAVSPTTRTDFKTTPNATVKSPVNQVPSTPSQPKVAPVMQVPQAPSPPYPEEIYDDAINVLPVDPLSNEVWYHGERDRKECEKDLTTKGKDGSFMVRKSTKGGDTQPYTLVVLYKSHVYNLRIRKRPDNKIALGNEKEAEQELAFDSVPELIEHHTSNEVILINNSENRQYKALLKDALHMR